MKRLIAVVLLSCLLLCGCRAADPTQEPTPATTQPSPENPTDAPTAPPTEAPTEPVDPLADYRPEGWLEPERESIADIQWLSDTGYIFILFLEPEAGFDGPANISYIGENDNLISLCGGYWALREGKLFLELEGLEAGQAPIRGEFPVLCREDGLVIAPAEGQTLPFFREGEDVAQLTRKPQKSYYDYLLENAWNQPEKKHLTETGWVSYAGYALLLSTENGGTARLFKVQEDGTYVGAFLGSWSYQEGLLELELYHASNPGFLAQGAFPVLMLDGELTLFRTAEGRGLPYFEQGQEYDVFRKPEND